MKRLFALLFVLSGSIAADIQDDLKDVRYIRIDIDQSYQSAAELQLPIHEIASQLFSSAGFKLVGNTNDLVDTTLSVTINGKALVQEYAVSGQRLRYTGAEIEGSLSLQHGGSTLLEHPLKWIKQPPGALVNLNTGSRQYLTPEEAPFDEYLAQLGIEITHAIYMGWGLTPLFLSLEELVARHGEGQTRMMPEVESGLIKVVAQAKDSTLLRPLLRVGQILETTNGISYPYTVGKALYANGHLKPATKLLVEDLASEDWRARNAAVKILGAIAPRVTQRERDPVLMMLSGRTSKSVASSDRDRDFVCGQAFDPLVNLLAKTPTNNILSSEITRTLQRLSGKEFGTDIEAWNQWQSVSGSCGKT